jgi:hypothetical protein
LVLVIVRGLADAEDAVDVADDGMAFVVGKFAPGVHHGTGGEALFFLLGAVFFELEDGAAEAGEGVSDAHELVGVGVAASLEIGQVTEQFANGEGGELEAAFGQGDRVGIAQAGEGIGAGEDLVAPELVFEVVLVTAGFPFGEVVLGDLVGQGRGMGVGEFFDDLGIAEAVIEQEIDLVTNEFGEAGDFAATFSTGEAGPGRQLGGGYGVRRVVFGEVRGRGWRAGGREDGDGFGCLHNFLTPSNS